MDILSSTRLKLRAPELGDLDYLYHWENDTSLWFVSNTIAPFSRYMLEQYILSSHQDLFSARQLRLMIVPKGKNSVPVGIVDLFDYEPIHRRAGIGILIEHTSRRRGYATETITMIIRYAFEVLNLHQLYCHVHESNKASLELFRKMQFVEAGVLRDWVLKNNQWENVILMQRVNDNQVIFKS